PLLRHSHAERTQRAGLGAAAKPALAHPGCSGAATSRGPGLRAGDLSQLHGLLRRRRAPDARSRRLPDPRALGPLSPRPCLSLPIQEMGPGLPGSRATPTRTAGVCWAPAARPA
ncbi:hypothetical protein P7K49_020659, partial [Saguinus oedipus]